MKRRPPEALGQRPGPFLGRIGRIERYAAGFESELWRLPATDTALGERLLELGRRGIGRFIDGGVDGRGVWLLRAALGLRLSDFMLQDRALEERLAVMMKLARVLAHAEAEQVFAGPLIPRLVALGRQGEVDIDADAFVYGLFEARSPRAPASRRDLSFVPLAQADGKSWDHAANRYAFGLALYYAVSGEHAFGGLGLRQALEAQSAEPPPLDEKLVQSLPRGFQAFCLSLLDPDPKRRPRDARAIAEGFERLLSRAEQGKAGAPRALRDKPRAPPDRAHPAGVSPFRMKPRKADRATSSRENSGLTDQFQNGGAAALARPLDIFRQALPWALALLSAWVVFQSFDRPTSATPRPRSSPPLSGPVRGMGDCAHCHERQASEWRRSVMAHSVKSPLFLSLEALIQEQVERSFACENGAGILRPTDGVTGCVDRQSGVIVTGAGGPGWCVNCHAAADSVFRSLPAWDAHTPGSLTRAPLTELLDETALEGVGCAVCHQAHGPVTLESRYRGNPDWQSIRTGRRFSMRPEEGVGFFGIANSGALLAAGLLAPGIAAPASASGELVPGGVHRRTPDSARDYIRSSEFCGACHDVRLFGSDVLGSAQGEHFKRLRNAYSEWRAFKTALERGGQAAPSCQACHMSAYPGVCVPDRDGERREAPASSVTATALRRACPPGTHFEARPANAFEASHATGGSGATHYFSGVDVPLSPSFPEALVDDPTLDTLGLPLGARQRRDLLLGASLRLALGAPRLSAGRAEVVVEVENVGAGHRIPAGFSQEREIWVELTLTDRAGRVIYDVGKLHPASADLRDKVFLRVNTSDELRDPEGRPLGMFGADVRDGPDVPRFSPPPDLGGTDFAGRGLINFQNGFLRCVVCLGRIDAEGRCQALPGQESARADRYTDGDYDLDTGVCRSNLSGRNALFETYFPVGALDATRGVLKAPDAIIDTRSLPPRVPVRYRYVVDAHGAVPPLRAEARLLFRAFPPYLIRAFIDYEASQARLGKRPSGPLIDERSLERLEVVELSRAWTEGS